jgi:hypothetical protein
VTAAPFRFVSEESDGVYLPAIVAFQQRCSSPERQIIFLKPIGTH